MWFRAGRPAPPAGHYHMPIRTPRETGYRHIKVVDLQDARAELFPGHRFPFSEKCNTRLEMKFRQGMKTMVPRMVRVMVRAMTARSSPL